MHADAGPFNKRSRTEVRPGAEGRSELLSQHTRRRHLSRLATSSTIRRLFNIYDGPAYEDTNAFLDITPTDCETKATIMVACMARERHSASRKYPGTEKCYLPNAAIAWKQPNGFFYPPAFHWTNLFFNNVDIRHYVIDPLFKQNTYI